MAARCAKAYPLIRTINVVDYFQKQTFITDFTTGLTMDSILAFSLEIPAKILVGKDA